jgi:AraC family transcriptional regulator of adaptative response/methylated-DNA-[protein]-cysteine methyltransferase
MLVSKEPAMDYQQISNDYLLVEKAIRFLEEHASRQPDLSTVAASVGMSEYHFQRLFSRWAGISPKRFLQYLTKEGAKQLLERDSVLGAAYGVGLSSPGRLHDLLVQTEAVTPGEYRLRGAGLDIRYGFHPTPFGECLIGLTGRGICHLSFVEASPEDSLKALHKMWPQAGFEEDQAATASLLGPIFELGQHPGEPLSLYLSGTNFQLKVWEALLRIPPGQAATYQAIARLIGQPAAARAVGNAVGHNPVAVLIPCHRVLRKAGEFGSYRWGTPRKKAILGREAAAMEIQFETR